MRKYFFLMFTFLILLFQINPVKGDWVMIGGVMTHQNSVNTQPIIDPVVSVLQKFPESFVPSAPVIENNRIYLNAANCCMAFDEMTGESLWNYSADTANIESIPCVGLYHIFFGSNDGYIYALNVSTGYIDWKYHTGGRIRSSPTIDLVNQIVTVGSDDGYVYAFNALTGAKLWNSAKVSTVVTIGSTASSVTASVGYIYAFPITTTTDGTITSIGINWAGNSTSGNMKVGLYANVLNAPAVLLSSNNNTAINHETGWQDVAITPCSIRAGTYWIAIQQDTPKTVYYVSSMPNYYYSSSYKAFDNPWTSNASHNDGQWNMRITYNDNIYASPAIYNHLVYCGTSAGRFYALNETTGAIKWTTSLGSYFPTTAVISNNSIVYFNSQLMTDVSQGMTFALNATTGSIIWSNLIKTDLLNFPAISLESGMIYVTSTDNYLYVFSYKTGYLLWTYATLAPISAAPVIVQDLIYLGSTDGLLYCINNTSHKKVWSLATNGILNQPFAVDNNALYYVTADPTLQEITNSAEANNALNSGSNSISTSTTTVSLTNQVNVNIAQIITETIAVIAVGALIFIFISNFRIKRRLR